MPSVNQGIAIRFTRAESLISLASPQFDSSFGGGPPTNYGWYGGPRQDLLGTFSHGTDYLAFRFSQSLGGIYEPVPPVPTVHTYYLMMANSSVTGLLVPWMVIDTPDMAGASFPGPGVAVGTAIAGQRTV